MQHGVDTPSLVADRHSRKPLAFSRRGPSREASLIESPQRFEPTLRNRRRYVKRLMEKRENISGSNIRGMYRRFTISDAILRLAKPMFGVEVEGERYYASLATLIDWRQNRVAYNVTSYPVLFDVRSKRREQTLGDRLLLYADRHNIRRNSAGMGLAQEAYRLATIEGHKDQTKLALAWLWSGSLETAIQEVFAVGLSKDASNFLARLLLEPLLGDKI